MKIGLCLILLALGHMASATAGVDNVMVAAAEAEGGGSGIPDLSLLAGLALGGWMGVAAMKSDGLAMGVTGASVGFAIGALFGLVVDFVF